MDILLNPLGWLVVGVVVMLLELIIPGGIVVFLGAACVIVAGAIYIGLVSTWSGALTLFFISSLGLVIILRSFISRFIEGDSTVANTEELLDDLDEFVEVIKTIGPADKAGMVKFKGTQWKALGDGQEIAIGSTARIVSRENITLLVKPVDSIKKTLPESDT